MVTWQARTFWIKEQWNYRWKGVGLLNGRGSCRFPHPGTPHHVRYYSLHVDETLRSAELGEGLARW